MGSGNIPLDAIGDAGILGAATLARGGAIANDS